MDMTGSNAPVAAALRQMAESGRIPHAMLFHENDGGGAFLLALDFLDEVYGHNPRVRKLIHPDIHFVFPVAGSDKPVSDQFIANGVRSFRRTPVSSRTNCMPPSASRESRATSR
jgi:DNA polymerase-3 subunit delta'